jgi:hypothetical protein
MSPATCGLTGGYSAGIDLMPPCRGLPRHDRNLNNFINLLLIAVSHHKLGGHHESLLVEKHIEGRASAQSDRGSVVTQLERG